MCLNLSYCLNKKRAKNKYRKSKNTSSCCCLIPKVFSVVVEEIARRQLRAECEFRSKKVNLKPIYARSKKESGFPSSLSHLQWTQLFIRSKWSSTRKTICHWIAGPTEENAFVLVILPNFQSACSEDPFILRSGRLSIFSAKSIFIWKATLCEKLVFLPRLGSNFWINFLSSPRDVLRKVQFCCKSISWSQCLSRTLPNKWN